MSEGAAWWTKPQLSLPGVYTHVMTAAKQPTTLVIAFPATEPGSSRLRLMPVLIEGVRRWRVSLAKPFPLASPDTAF